jgi:phosphatidylinositol glycan class N
MFARGAVPGRVKTWMYDEDDEDFTKGMATRTVHVQVLIRVLDATELDWWSLEHLKNLLKNATTDNTLSKELRQEKVVFFLHLLGLDTTGHSYRPFSKVWRSTN